MPNLTPSRSSRPKLPSPEAIEAERTRRRYVRDPVAWVREQLRGFAWSKQREILESVRDHRRTAVKSCHGAGKSYISAQLSCWWIATHPPGEAFVVTSATTTSQVRAVLWREMNRTHATAKLPGRMNQVEWMMTMPAGHEELVAFGRKPSDFDATAFQGIHARYVLVIFDEAAGIPAPLWEGAEGLLSNDDSRLLTIGNPTEPTSPFAEACAPGSGHHVITISAFDTPNFTDEPVPDHLRPLLVGRTWVDEKRKKWGETNPLWTAKVLGEFPQVSQDGLIPIAWVAAAQRRDLRPTPPEPPAVGADDAARKAYDDAQRAFAAIPHELGVDVGGGRDKNIVAHRHGPWVRIIRRDTNPDTMQTCGHIVQDLRATGATMAKVDYIGIGRGVVDRGRELGEPFVGINVGEPARDPEAYLNLRAELWWGVRERFQAGDVDIDADDDDLAAQLCAIKFKPTSRGQIQIESKDEMRRRGMSSPDDADALMLALAKPAREPGDLGITI